MSVAPSLLIDLGNTSLKWALYRSRSLGQASRVQHRGQDLSALLDRRWGSQSPPARVLLASVAGPAAEERIRRWVLEHWHRQLVQIRSRREACGVVNAYSHPDRLGVDRWLTLIAVHRQIDAPACIVDCGTAVTLDGLDATGRHLGGLILPGLEMMRDALLRNTQIDAPASVDWAGVLARDTAGAVAAGGLFACAGLVELVVRRIAQDCGRVPQIVLTGGDGAKLQAVLETGARYEPDLVLQGLAQLAGDMES